MNGSVSTIELCGMILLFLLLLVAGILVVCFTSPKPKRMHFLLFIEYKFSQNMIEKYFLLILCSQNVALIKISKTFYL